MKVLLINPSFEKKSYTILPNIGIGYLAKSIQQNSDVNIIDCLLVNIDNKRLEKIIKKVDTKIIGFSLFSVALKSTNEFIKKIKEAHRNTTIIVGGPHVIFEPVETLLYLKEANYGFCGEAEEGFPMLLNILKETPNPSPEILATVPNLVWRNGGKIIVNARSYVDVNKYPIPAWDLIHPERYPAAPNGIFSRAKKIAPIIVTRGCPYPCTFCGAGIASGKKLRKRNIDNVIEEIKLLKYKFGIEEIHIMDDNFTLDMEYAKNVCRAIIKENFNLYFACPNGIRLDRIDEELLKLMERAGFYSFAVGIESGSQETLDYMRKELTLKEIREKIDLIKSASNIEVTGFFILGYPNEKKEDIEKTIRFALDLPIDKANFFNFTPFPGSTEYAKLKSAGKLKNIDYSHLYIHEIVYTNEFVSRKKLKWLQIKAHLLFYLRLRIIFNLIKEIKSLQQLKIIFQRVFNIFF